MAVRNRNVLNVQCNKYARYHGNHNVHDVAHVVQNWHERVGIRVAFLEQYRFVVDLVKRFDSF